MGQDLVADARTTIDAPVAVVWDALVNPASIRAYMFGTTVVSDWKVGSPITWKGEWKGKAYEDKGRILIMRPTEELSYSHYSPLSGLPDVPENHHKVTFRLYAQGPRTVVTITQDNNADEDARKHSAEMWSGMLKGLKDFIEQQGRAQPHA